MGHFDFGESDYADESMPSDLSTVLSAIGEIVMWFEDLDEQLSTAIGFLLRGEDEVGRIITAELSFRAKVNLFGALFRHDRPNSERLDYLRELCGACLQIEQKRNQVVHSKWRNQLDGLGMTRVKLTARGKHGLRRQTETLTPTAVTAIAEHCGYLAHSVDELMYTEYGSDYAEP